MAARGGRSKPSGGTSRSKKLSGGTAKAVRKPTRAPRQVKRKRLESKEPSVSVLAHVEKQFNQAAELLHLDLNVLRIIKQPRRSLIMRQSFADVLALALEHHTTMRIAAFMLAIRRVSDVILLRGVYT